jgi:hypothetical protein
MVRDWLARGAYRSFSVELQRDWQGTTHARNGVGAEVTGPVLRRVALMGADPPAVGSLEDISALVAQESPVSEDLVRCVQMADKILVSIPALPASELRFAEGPTLLAGILEPTLQERLQRLERAIAHEVIVMKEIKRTFTAPTPANAGDVSGTDNLELTFLSAVEGVMQTFGWDRLDPSMRQRAADIVLRESDPSLDPGMEAVSRVVNDTNPRQGGFPDAVTLVPGAHATAIGQMREDPFLARMSEVIAAKGWSMESEQDRRRAATIIRADHPQDVPLTPHQMQECNRLGGKEQYFALRDIATKLDLDLGRATERAICERKLWESRARGVRHSACWEEAIHQAMAREGMRFSEPASKRDAAQLVFKERPDLVSVYGSGIPKPQAEPAPPTSDAAGAELLRLTEVEISALHWDPLDDADRRKAVERVLKKHPTLRPDYGSRGRS